MTVFLAVILGVLGMAQIFQGVFLIIWGALKFIYELIYDPYRRRW